MLLCCDGHSKVAFSIDRGNHLEVKGNCRKPALFRIASRNHGDIADLLRSEGAVSASIPTAKNFGL